MDRDAKEVMRTDIGSTRYLCHSRTISKGTHLPSSPGRASC